MVRMAGVEALRKVDGAGAEYFKGRLLSERRRLQRRLVSWLNETSAGSPGSAADELDMAADRAEIDNSYRIGTVESDIVRQIDLALEKLESGAFGLCEACGARIPSGRLHTLPFVSMCVPCQEKHERRRSGKLSMPLRWEGPCNEAAEPQDPCAGVTVMSRDKARWWDR